MPDVLYITPHFMNVEPSTFNMLSVPPMPFQWHNENSGTDSHLYNYNDNNHLLLQVDLAVVKCAFLLKA